VLPQPKSLIPIADQPGARGPQAKLLLILDNRDDYGGSTPTDNGVKTLATVSMRPSSLRPRNADDQQSPNRRVGVPCSGQPFGPDFAESERRGGGDDQAEPQG
jgi:hypothetical protein